MKLNWFSQRSFHLLHLLPFLCHHTAANTEIINFSSSPERSVDLPWDVVGNWSTLHPSDNERRCSLEPAALHTPLRRVCERERSRDDADTVASASQPPFSCPHELWLFLDLDDEKWAFYSTFTLRLSWPASIPADFAITTYTPEQLLAEMKGQDTSLVSSGLDSTRTRTTTTTTTTTTRARYARIRAVDAGVLVPGSGSRSPRGISISRASGPQLHHHHHHHTHAQPDSDFHSDSESMEAEKIMSEAVPFIIILEPMYMGVLPATLLPTVGFLVPVLLTAALLVVPWVTVYLETFAQQARVDGFTRTSKDQGAAMIE